MEKIVEIFKKFDSFALFCHISPDADTLCSANALKLVLKKLKKKAYIFCDGKVPKNMKFLGISLEQDEKIIENVDVLKTTEVPMDGNIYYFPKADGSEIYSKQWLANGTTRILTFKPVFEDNTNTLSSDTEKLKIGLSDDVTDAFMKRFDELEKRLEEFISKSANKSTTRTKKDGDLDV